MRLVYILVPRGRAIFCGELMGSVAEKVIRHSTKPLFIIPTRQKNEMEDLKNENKSLVNETMASVMPLQ